MPAWPDLVCQQTAAGLLVWARVALMSPIMASRQQPYSLKLAHGVIVGFRVRAVEDDDHVWLDGDTGV